MLSLRSYQQAAITAIYNYFADKSGHPLVVIPTAGGKSVVLAAFIQGVLRQWPDQRILIVTHVRELIAQNHAEMIGLWPEAPAGIYSAAKIYDRGFGHGLPVEALMIERKRDYRYCINSERPGNFSK